MECWKTRYPIRFMSALSLPTKRCRLNDESRVLNFRLKVTFRLFDSIIRAGLSHNGPLVRIKFYPNKIYHKIFNLLEILTFYLIFFNVWMSKICGPKRIRLNCKTVSLYYTYWLCLQKKVFRWADLSSSE